VSALVSHTAVEPRRVGGYAARQVTLLDLLDRLLEGGVVIQGDVTLAVADIDLVDLSLRVLVAAVESAGRDLRGPLNRTAGRP
jgi:hypothetical protein